MRIDEKLINTTIVVHSIPIIDNNNVPYENSLNISNIVKRVRFKSVYMANHCPKYSL